MRDLAKKSYSKEAFKKLAERGFTEEDQKNFNQKYTHFKTEIKRLFERGIDQANPEAQAVGQLLYDINNNRIKEILI